MSLTRQQASGDILSFRLKHCGDKPIFGISFFIAQNEYFLMVDGVILSEDEVTQQEWICRTSLSNTDCFHSLEQVKKDHALGKFRQVTDILEKVMNWRIEIRQQNY